MPSSIVGLVEQDHDRMVRMLARVAAKSPHPERWRDELVALFRAHVAGEVEALPASSGEAASRLEHVVRELADVPATSTIGLAAVCSRLEEALLAHQREIHALLAAAGQALPRKELRRLGGRYEEVRDGVLSAAATPRTLDRPRADLYEMARRFGIEGRSSMTRSQLINALKSRTSS